MAATYYELLGIPEDADAASIAKAFRKEIQKSHPDLNQSDGTAKKHSQLLNEAKRTLGDPAKRKAYDEKLLKRRRSSQKQASPQPNAQSNSAAGPEQNAFQQDFDFASEDFSTKSSNTRSPGSSPQFSKATQSSWQTKPGTGPQSRKSKTQSSAHRWTPNRQPSQNRKSSFALVAIILGGITVAIVGIISLAVALVVASSEPREALVTTAAPSPPVNVAPPTSIEKITEPVSATSAYAPSRPAWIDQAKQLTQLDFDNALLTNTISGASYGWRQSDRAKGRWVAKFKAIPNPTARADRFESPRGAANGVFFLNGDSDYTLRSFTISIWLQWVNDSPGEEYRVLLNNCSKVHLADCNYMLAVRNEAKGGELLGVVSGTDRKPNTIISDGVKVTDGKWHHAALTCDAAKQQLSLYVDGKQCSSMPITNGVNGGKGFASVGYWRGHNWMYGLFNGAMDDLRIFTEPLNDIQIRELYDYEAATSPSPPAAYEPLEVKAAQTRQVAWAKHLGVPVESQNSAGMIFRSIPPGRFMMGAEVFEEDEKPRHAVELTRPIEFGIHEVTQEQFVAVMGKNPSQAKATKNPVEQVTWEEAREFCQRLSDRPEEKAQGYVYRLPTEAEWEYACRAGTTTDFSFGPDASGLVEFGWSDGNSDGKHHPVGEKKPNAWGLFDMHGNVGEWCYSWMGDYSSDPETDPVGPLISGTTAVRGGHSWGSATDCRSSVRLESEPDAKDVSIGFRVVRVRL